MAKPDSWQVGLLRMYLRIVISPQLSRGNDTDGIKALLKAVRQPLSEREIATLERILHARMRLRQSHETIEVRDHGTGASQGSDTGPSLRAVSAIHRSSAVPHWWGVFLFRQTGRVRRSRLKAKHRSWKNRRRILGRWKCSRYWRRILVWLALSGVGAMRASGWVAADGRPAGRARPELL